VQILGELVPLVCALSSVAWTVRCIIRDVLDYRYKREVLRRTPDDQVVKVVRRLDADRRKIRD
jgi:hypothetical protein